MLVALRKGEETVDSKLRRPKAIHVAKIKHEDPFTSADLREIDAALPRVAAADVWHSAAGRREESGFLPFFFQTWAKARAE